MRLHHAYWSSAGSHRCSPLARPLQQRDPGRRKLPQRLAESRSAGRDLASEVVVISSQADRRKQTDPSVCGGVGAAAHGQWPVGSSRRRCTGRRPSAPGSSTGCRCRERGRRRRRRRATLPTWATFCRAGVDGTARHALWGCRCRARLSFAFGLCAAGGFAQPAGLVVGCQRFFLLTKRVGFGVEGFQPCPRRARSP